MTQTATHPDWMTDAACARQDPLMWDEAGGPDLVAQGVAICRTCPVWQDCRAHAEATQPHGTVWAGLLYLGGDGGHQLGSQTFNTRLARIAGHLDNPTAPPRRAADPGRDCAQCGDPLPAGRRKYCTTVCYLDANRAAGRERDRRRRAKAKAAAERCAQVVHRARIEASGDLPHPHVPTEGVA